MQGVSSNAAAGVAGTGWRSLLVPRRRLMLVLVTAAVGLLAAFGLATLVVPEQRTFAGVVPLTQLIMSVLTPFSAVLLTSDVHQGRTGVAALPQRWLTAAVYGLIVGAYGAVVAALAVNLAVSSGAPVAADPWAGAGALLLGSLVVQLIPVGVGCGAGLLIFRPLRAQLATVVVPLAVSFVLPRFSPAGTTDWVTPLAAVDHLLPGPMTALGWLQWLVTAALWVVLPNAIGARLLTRPARPRRSARGG